MEWLFIFGLMAALAGLLGRLRTAERRIETIEQAQDDLLHQLRQGSVPAPADEAVPATVEEAARPARRRASVPKVIVRRDETSAEALPPSVEPSVEPAAPATVAAAEDPAPGLPPFRVDLEDVFGRRLPIWAGGVALAVAGVFLVRYSIERGLITPLLRVVMAFVFGFGLLAGAEAAYRFRERVADPRVGQALAGAGLATLYAAFYLAGTQYGLIGQTLAFVGLAAVTAGAIALSFRFGLPSAVLGLVGGFAAPALVGGEEANLPLLALYLGLVTTGLTVSGSRQGRPWMGIAALVGGLGWGALLLLTGDPGFAEVLALGLYFVVLGAVLPAMAGGERYRLPLRLASAGVASIQLALLVDQGGYSPLAWGLYLLLGATLAFFDWRKPEMRGASAIAAAVALILLAQWDGAGGFAFAVAATAIAAIFAGVPLALIWREREHDGDSLQLAGAAVGVAVVAFASFGDLAADAVEPVLALASVALAALPAAAALRLRRRDNARMLAVQMAASAALVFAALLMVTPFWSAPLCAAAVFAGLFVLSHHRAEPPLTALLWGAAAIAIGALAASVRFGGELEHLAGWSPESRGGLPLLRWLAVLPVFAAVAWREALGERRRAAECLAAALAYGVLAQVLPGVALAWTAALLAIAARFLLPERTAAQLAALAIAALWTLEPLGWWLAAVLESLGGVAVFATGLPAPRDVATRLLPLLAALAVVRLPAPAAPLHRVPPYSLAVALGLVIAHILFKQLFAIADSAAFVVRGLAERTLWEALLLGAGWLAARGVPRLGPQPGAALALASAALGHFLLYTGLQHNPLWAAQALGPLPLANLATAAYGLAIAAALLLRRWSLPRFTLALDAAVMGLACLAVLTLLRQAFAGSLPASLPLSQTEDLLRSLAGILLALFFLWVGGRTGERSWRLGSLAIMLVAVAKVFLVDAAGLDGLLRVASFMALGFSLIGIGWVYTRQLRARPVRE